MIEPKDILGNLLAIGDPVATAMTSRHAGNVRTGTIRAIGVLGMVVRMDDSGRDVSRRPCEVVKAVRP